MRTTEEIVRGLECFRTKQKPCDGCPFNPLGGMEWPYGCGRGEAEIAEAAQEALRGAKAVRPTWRRGCASCGECGRRVIDGYRYCPLCGRKVEWP
jgi:hypothetical protein